MHKVLAVVAEVPHQHNPNLRLQPSGVDRLISCVCELLVRTQLRGFDSRPGSSSETEIWLCLPDRLTDWFVEGWTRVVLTLAEGLASLETGPNLMYLDQKWAKCFLRNIGFHRCQCRPIIWMFTNNSLFVYCPSQPPFAFACSYVVLNQ